ncbi:Uncharacterised protein [Mycobacterium xenopi]|uniref:Uncharacterized protein n=1 Tax=Mycobacterium xenopi TaxID=1789 RepID=A0AAD1M2P5_MYCXE|nr:hypothetical protein I552_7053 [Mycobacterium xenopi 3993]BBU24443.1 hypothetical protein MYXE_42330 [Mycobacterium xenopi]SPX90261.1 Uncharacterised protein [Mycobacterium xenopi]
MDSGYLLGIGLTDEHIELAAAIQGFADRNLSRRCARRCEAGPVT